VAAVLADTAEIAEQALELDRSRVRRVADGDRPRGSHLLPAPIQVHEGGVARAELRGSTYGAPERFSGTNICYYLTFGREDVEKGFAKAEHIFEDTFRFQKVQALSLSRRTTMSPTTTAKS
jgi:CO/xanthine dehydrogenase Mo-binding subunit